MKLNCFFFYLLLSLIGASVSVAQECCIFYEHLDGKGESLRSGTGARNRLGDTWNDRITSVRVAAGCKVTIYEHPDFGGKSHTLFGGKKDMLYNLTDIGFDDSISSYMAEKDRGRMGETDSDSRIYCKFYEHPNGNGSYLRSGIISRGVIGDRWNDKISSIWVQDGYKVTIYEHPDFGGKSHTLFGNRNGSLYNLTDIDFDDRISSYIVESGRGRAGETDSGSQIYCRFYKHPHGKEAYFMSGLGSRREIESRWNDEISSVWVEDGYKVTLYEHPDFGGKSHTLYGKKGGALYNLTDIGFDDRVSSYKVEADRGDIRSFSKKYCEFYEHPDGQGSHFRVRRGRRKSMGRWNDKVSSIWVQNGYRVTIYEHESFGGRKHILYGRSNGTLYNLTDINFNDIVSSYEVEKD